MNLWTFANTDAPQGGLSVTGWTLTDTTAFAGGTVKQTWRNTSGSTALLNYWRQDGQQRCEVEIHASPSTGIDAFELCMPYCFPPSGDRGVLVFSADGGGFLYPWNDTDYGHGNSGVWPGNSFSPLAAFVGNLGGLGVTLWNNELLPSRVQWVTDPGGGKVNCFGQFMPSLDPGGHTSFVMEMRSYEGADAAQQHAGYYARQYLYPWLKLAGIAPKQWASSKPWIRSNYPPDDGGMIGLAQRAAQIGGGVIVWATSSNDPGKVINEPDPTKAPWFGDFAAASKVAPIWCEINPFAWDITGRVVNLDSKEAVDWFHGLVTKLMAAGVSGAYWDMGGQPTNCKPWQWLSRILTLAGNGIAVATERGCDIALAAGRAVLLEGWAGKAPLLPQWLGLPGTVLILDEQNKTNWAPAVLKAGMVPILMGDQVTRYQNAAIPLPGNQ